MLDKSPDIQSYLICFGSNDSFSHFSPAGPPTVPLSRGRDHLHQLQPGPAEDQPEPGGPVHVRVLQQGREREEREHLPGRQV